MEIYWIALFISLIISQLLTNNQIKIGIKRGKITFLRVFIALLPLFFVALFRWNVGNDVSYGTGHYFKTFYSFAYGEGNSRHYEIGFYLLMRLCYFLHLNLYFFYCVCTTIFFVSFSKYICENTRNITISILLFFLSDLYLFSFSTLREIMGIAFILYPISEFIKGRKVLKNSKWWICSIIACSMHVSVLYLLILVVVSSKKIEMKKLMWITMIGCVASFPLNQILEKLVATTHYFQKYFGTNEYHMNFTMTYFLIALVVFIACIYFSNKLIAYNDKAYMLINFSGLALILMTNSEILLMPYRIFQLFVPLYIMIVGIILSIIKKRKVMLNIVKIYFILPFLIMFINQYYMGKASFLPIYHSIFEYWSQVFG